MLLVLYLFNPCQLNISYAKCVNYCSWFLIEERECHFLPAGTGRWGIIEKVTNGDIEREGSKILHFCGDVIFE